MARFALSIGGMVLGNLLPGISSALGGALGSYVGGLVDQQLFGSEQETRTVTGPRLQDLRVQSSSYCGVIPRVVPIDVLVIGTASRKVCIGVFPEIGKRWYRLRGGSGILSSPGGWCSCIKSINYISSPIRSQHFAIILNCCRHSFISHRMFCVSDGGVFVSKIHMTRHQEMWISF
jgi:hypothetical protein